MAGQDDDHILQLINQNEERNRQAFNPTSNNHNNQFNNHNHINTNTNNNHHASSAFSVAGRISSLVEFEFRPTPVAQLQSMSQANTISQTSGMFNPSTFNNNAANHHQHLKAASQAQAMMQQQQQQQQQHQQQQNNPSNPNAIYHHNQMTNMGNNNQLNHGYPVHVMSSNHQLLGGQIPIPNSMAPQSSRLTSGSGGGSVPSNQQLSVSSNLSIPAGTAPFVVHGQSNNNFRPASSETTNKRSSSKNGNSDSPRRTFACPTCGKGFTEKFNMKRHMQIHSQSRPKYICNECSKSFAWKDNFIRHKKAAHGTNSIQYHV